MSETTEPRPPADNSAERPYRSAVGASRDDAIFVRGYNLASQLMGRIDFGDMAYLLVSGELPTRGQSVMFNAVLVALADHGMTATALAARLTYTGAPDSLQGAVASGLLGAGSVFLGVTEDTARLLADVLVEAGGASEEVSSERLATAAETVVGRCVDSGRRVPGIGHSIHRQTDPRTTRFYELAVEHGVLGPHLRALRQVHAAAQRRLGPKPINGAGAAGAVLADLGFPPEILRGFPLIARTAGLLAHIREEMSDPIGMPLWKGIDDQIENTATYREGSDR